MASNRDAGTPRGRALLVICFLCLLGPFQVGAQENGNAQQDDSIHPILPSEALSVGSVFQLEFEFPHPGGSDFPEITLPELGRVLVPAGEPVTEDVVTRVSLFESTRELRVRIPLRAVEPGRVVVEEVLFDFGSEQLWSEPGLVEVQPRGGGPIPFDLVWIIAEEELFVGQTVPVSLEMRNLRQAGVPDRVNIQEPSNAEFVSVPGLGGIERQEVGGATLLSIPVAAFLLTPHEAGTLLIPGAELSSGGLTRQAPALSINVLELPEPARVTGAYGRFEYSFELSPQQMREGSSSMLYIRLHGEGNFTQLQLPSFQSEDFIVAAEGIRSRLEPSPGGYHGSLEARYRLTPRRSGTLTLSVPPFVWFDAVEEDIRQTRPSALRVEVLEGTHGDSGEAGAPQFQPLGVDEILRMKAAGWYRSPASYLALLPGLVILVLGTVVRRRRAALGSAALLVGLAGMALITGSAGPSDQADPRLSAAVAAHEASEYLDALALYGELLEHTPDSPGLWHNAGLAFFNAELPAEAVFSLRQAVLLNPGIARLRTVLAEVETALQLERRLDIPFAYHPDIFFLVFVALMSAVMIVAGLSKLRGSTVIAIILLSLGSVFSAGALVYSVGVVSAPVHVVVNQGAGMKRIPDIDAATWLHLPGGTAVDVSVNHDEFILVRTGERVKGWIEADRVISSPSFQVQRTE